MIKKILRFIISVAVVLAVFTNLPSSAEDKIHKIGTFPIPLMVESSEKGVFIDLVKELAKRSGVKIEIVVEPTKRTTSNFEKGKISGFFPALDVSVPKKAEASSEIYIKKDYGFVVKGNTPPKSISDLEGKTIGLTAGYPYVNEITGNKKIKINYANTDELNVKKLINKRYDVFIVEEKSGLNAIKKENGSDKVTYDHNSPLSQQKVYFAFQPDAEGKELAKKFSDALAEIKNDGTFSKIMQKTK